MDQKKQEHYEKMQQLKKHFKRLKRRAILIWIVIYALIIAAAVSFLDISMVIATIIITGIASTMIMINYLNRLDKIRVTQETQLMEDTPLSRLKF